MKICKNFNCIMANPQPLNNFHKSTYKDGLKKECKTCCNEKEQIRRLINYEEYRKKDSLRRYKTYGLTKSQFDTLVLNQNNVCAICNKNGKNRLVIDHCHKTGKLRGLLCFSCNRSIAILDNKILLGKALKYLNYY